MLCVAMLISNTQAHGIFWNPTSRAQLAQLSGWEKDATSIISEPMPGTFFLCSLLLCIQPVALFSNCGPVQRLLQDDATRAGDPGQNPARV